MSKLTDEEIEDLKKRCELADDVISKVYRYSENTNQINELVLAKSLETYNNFLAAISKPETTEK